MLLKEGHEMGDYATLDAAREVAQMLAQQIRREGDECEILIHDGDWRDEACPEGQGTETA